MATVNLGRIKPVFRGAYDNSTAYVIDDIVTSGNETFIAIAATQGNATSDASKWTKLAAKGADGTDVAATLANKEISFKTNAGALDGIPIGNAGEFLKVNSGATGYEFGAVSSDVVKLYSQTLSSSVGTWYIDNIFDDTTYAFYEYRIFNLSTTSDSGGSVVRWRVNTATNTSYTTSQYYAIGQYADAGTSGSSDSNSRAWGNDKLSLSQNNLEADNFSPLSGYIRLYNPQSTSIVTNFDYGAFSVHSGASSIYNSFINAGYINSLTNWTGISLFADSGSLDAGTVVVYGYKK